MNQTKKIKTIKPMLAASLSEEILDTLDYSSGIFASIKLDGCRALKLDNRAVTRSLKSIPNKFIYLNLVNILANGCDGELMLSGKSSFQDITSAFMSFDGEPDFRYYLFDFDITSDKTYKERLESMAEFCHSCDSRIVPVFPKLIFSKKELLEYEKESLLAGYEGLILRDPNGKYKFGRSTLKEKGMLKLKRFTDSECEIIDFEALTINNNPIKINELGRSQRSSSKENLIETDMLGTLIVKDIYSNEEFRIGSGFTELMRQDIWNNKEKYKKMIVKYKYFNIGVKDAPRQPIFLGFRSILDL